MIATVSQTTHTTGLVSIATKKKKEQTKKHQELPEAVQLSRRCNQNSLNWVSV